MPSRCFQSREKGMGMRESVRGRYKDGNEEGGGTREVGWELTRVDFGLEKGWVWEIGRAHV